MAKGKKSKGNSYKSQGIHCQNKSWARKVRKLNREENPGAYFANLAKEWRAGKNPWLTIDNPNTKDTRARKIRVRSNDYWGDWKSSYTMKVGADT